MRRLVKAGIWPGLILVVCAVVVALSNPAITRYVEGAAFPRGTGETDREGIALPRIELLAD